MSNTIILGGAPVELDSAIGYQFVVDCVRAAEGLITDKELVEIYEISPADWQNIIKDTALARAIRAERDRRVRSGTAAREAAAQIFVRAPKITSIRRPSRAVTYSVAIMPPRVPGGPPRPSARA
jgi:hypothetical protein